MRILIFTGKGGVGKTSVSASTAVKAASQGYKTLVMSTDPAHSLADSFDINEFLGPDPREIAKNLYGLEVDIYEDLRQNWDVVRLAFSSLMSSQGANELLADEFAILPGMDELFSLVRIKRYYETREYDVLVVDCAPTGETLRMLSLPETLKWAMKSLRQAEKYVMKPLLRPLSKVTAISKMAIPQDMFDTVDKLFTDLEGLSAILSNTDVTTVRLVMNPEKMVIKESQRALTYLGMYGLQVDRAIVNRILPVDEDTGYLNRWKGIQQKHLHEIHDSFTPLPINHVPYYQEEVVGLEALTRMANDIYGDTDVAAKADIQKPYEITKIDNYYELSMFLPFAKDSDLDLWHKGDEFIVQVANQRRIATLPLALAGMEAGEADFDGKHLIVQFRTPVGAKV
jgi:arsenite-transporting ATPase